MLIFKGVSWNELATAAVACISPAGVWWTFWPGHRERIRERRQKRLAHLRQVNQQLEHIGQWARTSYSEGSHNPEWYAPGWAVRAFPWDELEQFNQVVIAGDYRRELTAALVSLEAAAQRFHRMLETQLEYLKGAPDNAGPHAMPVIRAAMAKGGPLTQEEISSIGGISAGDQSWLLELYRRNKELHVSGIGGAGEDWLHHAWRVATIRLELERAALQHAGDPGWRWAGHILASLFGLIGLLFLFDFCWSFAADVSHRKSGPGTGSVSSVPIDSTIAAILAFNRAEMHVRPN